MPDEMDADVVHLTLPPDADLEPVLEVAVAVLGRRVRLTDPAVHAARAAVSDAFAEVAAGGGVEPVEIEIAVRLDAGQLEVRLRSGPAERTFTAP